MRIPSASLSVLMLAYTLIYAQYILNGLLDFDQTLSVYKLASLRSQGWGYLTTHKKGLILEVNAFFHKLMNRRETFSISYLFSAYNIPSFHITEMSGKYACTAMWSHSLNLANILMNRCFFYIYILTWIHKTTTQTKKIWACLL